MPEPAKIAFTDFELDAALEQARRYAKYARRVVKASYSETTGHIRMVFDDGSSYVIPCRLLQGLADGKPTDLKRIQIVGVGTGLLWPALDVSHYVPGLLQGVYGSEKWMAALRKPQRKLRRVKIRHDAGRKDRSRRAA